MPSEQNSNNVDPVAEMIDDLYKELMQKRFELIDLRRQKRKDISEQEILLIDLQKDFDSIVKTHTIYLKFMKASGKEDKNVLADIVNRIRQSKSAVGQIVKEVPKQ